MTTISACLEYPRIEGQPNTVRISLVDVRAAQDIEVSYDFDRDGWSIKRPTIFEWDVWEDEYDEGLTEVAFIPSHGVEP